MAFLIRTASTAITLIKPALQTSRRAWLWAGAAAALLPAVALAQVSGAPVQNEVNKLIHDCITWGQRIAGMLMIGGFLNAGSKFFSDEHADQAWIAVKKAAIGAIIVAGAVGLAQWIKGAFSTQTF